MMITKGTHPHDITNTQATKEWVESTDTMKIFTGEKPYPCDEDCPEDCSGEHYISSTFTDVFK